MKDQLHINIGMNCPLSNQDPSQIKKSLNFKGKDISRYVKKPSDIFISENPPSLTHFFNQNLLFKKTLSVSFTRTIKKHLNLEAIRKRNSILGKQNVGQQRQSF